MTDKKEVAQQFNDDVEDIMNGRRYNQLTEEERELAAKAAFERDLAEAKLEMNNPEKYGELIANQVRKGYSL